MPVVEVDLWLLLWSSSSSLLLLIEVYKGNELLHTLLVDNVNAKNMNNVDKQPSYINEKINFIDSKNKLVLKKIHLS
jgi:hypothetical protein